MWSTGDVLSNPITGERIEVRAGRADTGDDRVVVDLVLPAGHAGAGEHAHAAASERLEVLEGRLGYAIAEEGGLALPGDVLTIAPGTPHEWWNAGSADAVVRLDVWPAERFELLIETLYGLAARGRTNRAGTPGVLQLAVLARAFGREAVPAGPLARTRRALLAALAPLGLALGRRAAYAEHRELLLRYGRATVVTPGIVPALAPAAAPAPAEPVLRLVA
jgi:quercetin dioxygenase-like cupin family protein